MLNEMKEFLQKEYGFKDKTIELYEKAISHN